MRDTIEMAREAGYSENLSMLHAVALNRFAELVRADERESICKFMEHGVDLAGISSAPQLQNYTTTLLKTLADWIRARSQA